jgi:hypothetical protein
MAMAAAELRRRHRLHSRGYLTITAKKLADFLNSLEAEECLLLQRARDRESRSIIERINSGFGLAGNDRLPEDGSTQSETDANAQDGNTQTTAAEATPERRVARQRRVIEEF